MTADKPHDDQYRNKFLVFINNFLPLSQKAKEYPKIWDGEDFQRLLFVCLFGGCLFFCFVLFCYFFFFF